MKNKKIDKRYISPLILRVALASVLFLSGISAVLIFLSDSDNVRLTIFLLWAFCVIITFCAFVAEKKYDMRLFAKEAEMLNNVTIDFIQRLELPVFITDDEGNLMWYNDSFSSCLGNPRALSYGDNISKMTDGAVTVNDLLHKSTDIKLNAGKNHYIVESYVVSLYKTNCIVAIMKDRTDLDEALKTITMTKPVVAYIVIDNMGELSTNVQDKNRSVSNEVSACLHRMAASVNGVLKEYERDRYIFFFEYKDLLTFTSRKFDILDDVREITMNDSDMPVTISMGVASVDGTVSDKELVARSALELALQRGGDQVVLKYQQSTEYYGGKNKTVQKKSKLRSRVIATELINHMKKSSNILIMGHKFADHDSIGACIGIARLAMFNGCKANIVCDPEDGNFMNVIAKLRNIRDYDNFFVNGLMGLDLVGADTLLIVVDANNPQIFEESEIYKNSVKCVVIDHHRKTGEYVTQPVINYIEPSVSSTCEMVAEILEQSLPAGVLLKEEADILLSGIWLDTKQFSKNTGVRTFGAAVYLRSEGASPAETSYLFASSLDELMSEAKFESNVVIYLGRIAISVYDGTPSTVDKIAASKAADKLLMVSGVTASFVLYNYANSICISARSNGNINVQLILEKLNGGGHFDMAGAQMENITMSKALTVLKRAIDDYLTED